MSISRTLGALAVVATALIGSACTVRSYPPAADAYVYASTPPPPNIYHAPRGYYRGYTTYWYDDHWWYQSPRGWAYFRHEPPELQRYRPYVHQAPPAYPYPRGYGGGPGYGPGYTRPPLPAPR